ALVYLDLTKLAPFRHPLAVEVLQLVLGDSLQERSAAGSPAAVVQTAPAPPMHQRLRNQIIQVISSENGRVVEEYAHFYLDEGHRPGEISVLIGGAVGHP